MRESSSSSGGIGILGFLGITFVVLKLTHNIDWSWWWVTAPFWGGVALFAALALLTLIAMIVGEIRTEIRRRRRRSMSGRK